MKNFFIKNKIIILLTCIILILSISLFEKCFGMEESENCNFNLGIVNTEYLNLRSGAGINFDSIGILKKNEYVKIFSKIGEWYIVQNERNQIGTVHQKYITPTESTKTPTANTQEVNSDSTSFSLTEDEKTILNLINKERMSNGLSSLKIDEEIQNIAKLKATDLVQNNYFSHNSPIYGSPFEMLKSNNITYKTASENIAGNPNIENAVSSWLQSESHKKNILSNTFNYTGIAVVDSIAYGKIIVEIFIGR